MQVTGVGWCCAGQSTLTVDLGTIGLPGPVQPILTVDLGASPANPLTLTLEPFPRSHSAYQKSHICKISSLCILVEQTLILTISPQGFHYPCKVLSCMSQGF